MTTDLDELERIAKTATQDEWSPAHDVAVVAFDREEDIAHVMAFQPRVALELVHLLKHSRMINQQLLDNVCDAHEERDRLRALLREALEILVDENPDFAEDDRVVAMRKEAGL